MTKFLEQTASYLYEHHKDELRNVGVVLPSRRAAIFLKKYLSRITEKPVFAPQIYSIEDFVFTRTGLRKIVPAYLFFEFYEVYKQVEGEHAGPFREFVRWAEVVLQDFNEVDLYLVDPEQLFSYLSDAKALSLWNLDEMPLTSFETRYLQFFNSLAELYSKLQTKLAGKNIAYQGMAYRTLSEQLEEGSVQFPWASLYFVGFNALTASEEKIFRTISRGNPVRFLWDEDAYYVDDKLQEAGHFMRRNRKAFGAGDSIWNAEFLRETEKDIHFIGVPKNTGQAKVTGNLLNVLRKSNHDLVDTAIVLNDENLLFPVLNSLPEEIGSFNLTMGLPLKKTVLFGLVNDFVQMNENALRFDRSGGKALRFYYKDLLRVLEHPYFIRLAGNGTEGREPANLLRTHNKVFYTQQEFTTLLEPYSATVGKDVFAMLFQPWGNSAGKAIEGILYLLKRFKLLFAAGQQDSDRINTEYVFHFSVLFNKLKTIVGEYPFLSDLDSFRQVFVQMVRSVTIPFYGEPLQGIQIMGMLETRTLDFSHVIMLSVNEDFLPGRGFSNSFIPYEIRREFRLPTHRERNAVSAYHFYRLLQRANKVYLLYNTEAGELGGGDKSRFISQIEYELARINPGIRIHNEILSVDPGVEAVDDSIRIGKTDDLMERILERAGRGLSASALNTYRNCTLQFYFKYLLGLDEKEEVEETMEASTLGSVVHEVLFQLFSPFRGKTVKRDDYVGMLPKIDAHLAASFEKHYPGGDIRSGKNHLISKVAESFVRRFLEMEKERTGGHSSDLAIVGLEVPMETVLPLDKPIPVDVRLKGVIDRIDRLGKVTRIIDFKTGRVESRDLRLKEWDDLLIPGKADKLFQLLFYSFLCRGAGILDPGETTAGIYSFRNLGQGLLEAGLPGPEDLRSSMKEFEIQLRSMLEGLFDKKTPFRQTEEEKVCEYCSFRNICHR